ncbi:hypothetical protein ACHAC9_00805 [Massilia sp. CMS3.1]|uniref:hypothetical protein n=1 Tax=Massilia sp. CMS3.1 TaxID=3373083 RepID=UPI003EE7F855
MLVQLIEWENRTKKHPFGVCEAATMLWLQKIDIEGVQAATELLAQDCDDIQLLVEEGQISWLVHLRDFLHPNSNFHNGNVFAFTGQAIRELDVGDFIFITGGIHAAAMYKNQVGIFFFNPGKGMFLCQTSPNVADNAQSHAQLYNAVMSDAELGRNTFAKKGRLSCTEREVG